MRGRNSPLYKPELDVEKTCRQCGGPVRRYGKTYCSKECSVMAFVAGARTRRGESHPTYKGRVSHMHGYVKRYLPDHPLAHPSDGYVLEHRLVLHEAGIPIPDGAHVHHINGDPADNRLENLAVVSAREHKHRHTPPGTMIKNQHGVFPVKAR